MNMCYRMLRFWNTGCWIDNLRMFDVHWWNWPAIYLSRDKNLLNLWYDAENVLDVFSIDYSNILYVD